MRRPDLSHRGQNCPKVNLHVSAPRDSHSNIGSREPRGDTWERGDAHIVVTRKAQGLVGAGL